MKVLNLIAADLAVLSGLKSQVWVDFDLNTYRSSANQDIYYSGFCGTRLQYNELEVAVSTDAELKITADGHYSITFNQSIEKQWVDIKTLEYDDFKSETSLETQCLLKALPNLNPNLYVKKIDKSTLDFVLKNKNAMTWPNKPEQVDEATAKEWLTNAEIIPELNSYEFHESEGDAPNTIYFWGGGYLNAKLPYGFECYSHFYVDFEIKEGRTIDLSFDTGNLNYIVDDDLEDAFNLCLESNEFAQKLTPESKNETFSEIFKQLFLTEGIPNLFSAENQNNPNGLTIDNLRGSRKWRRSE